MADEKDDHEAVESPDIHFEPIVKLPEVEIKTLEDDEDQLVALRAKLFRFDKTNEPPEWKERGTGDVKIMKHKETGYVRVLMRRDKTLKLCANHYITPQMELMPNCGSDRAWVWSSLADFTDEEARPELLAIRFANAENAQKFKQSFDEGKELMKRVLPLSPTSNGVKASPCKKEDEESQTDEAADNVADKLESLTVVDKTKETSEEKTKTENANSEETKPADPPEEK